ncbi:P-loop containing nucleoside triphosphate hydrolase protein [Rhodofomes roseus]|uniref:P-loop containing nucleoside triphosphate hydrolase protein n=1 Tax=Rhodofomes roseus TaxID=34475 RepID=A0ABQ8KK60_9APHY|nr:P-loop containing nucleoside triphosphate hydrolase protein [Rhodofomes roseus]KAH9838486.1 P-loop containing nucleoside triphosphate hydrolase protein [Rhodofomes roseus]
MEIDEADLVDFPLDALSALSDDVVGVACTQGVKGRLTHLAFATPTHVLCIRMPGPAATSKPKKGKQTNTQQRPIGRDVLRRMLLHSTEHRKFALDMHTLALALYYDYQLTLVEAVDLKSVQGGDRRALDTLMNLLGGEPKVYKSSVADHFKGRAFAAGGTDNLAMRAWAACQAGSMPHLIAKLKSAALINTTLVPVPHLQWLAKFARVAWRLYMLKPTRVKNDVVGDFEQKEGQLHVGQARFKTRMRVDHSLVLVLMSGLQIVQIEYGAKNSPVKTVMGRTFDVNGKTAKIKANRYIAPTARIVSIVTIGRDDLTPAEKERESIMLEVLRRTLRFFEQDLVRKIFERPARGSVRRARASSRPVDLNGRRLNDSQAAAVNRIISENPIDQVCLVHGPPGTGKTTVIAASVLELMNLPNKDRGIWLIAQSNVAVKNIAEKLADVGFIDFKVLVSKDFHLEWHEHLYEMIERNVIRSDDFDSDIVGNERLLLGSKVMLCTLSMLSHPRLASAGFTRMVPLKTVIVDEASQIELSDYVPLLGRYGGTIKKLVFIGDDKQHRMPTPIGRFISQRVYGGRLKTIHPVTTRKSCIMVDVNHGEEAKSNNSWTNEAEAHAVVAIARKFHSEGKSYRVITPYDAQRNFLERVLENANLPWENKCFNVDSFQGKTEAIGFLSNLRRTNVMLSRCKQGMIICTSRAFMEGKAKSSLVGKLAKEWADGWVSWRDVLQGEF